MPAFNKIIALLFVMVLIGGGAGLSASADEIAESIEEALQYYKAGELNNAAAGLDYAAQLIRQKSGGELEAFLPEALPGWTAQDARSQAMGTSIFGGGISAARVFRKDNSRMEAKITADSPLLQSMSIMFSNPMLAAADGGRLEKIQGERAIVKYDSNNRNGSISIMVANRFLVQVEGREVEKQELVDCIGKIDFKKLAGFP